MLVRCYRENQQVTAFDKLNKSDVGVGGRRWGEGGGEVKSIFCSLWNFDGRRHLPSYFSELTCKKKQMGQQSGRVTIFFSELNDNCSVTFIVSSSGCQGQSKKKNNLKKDEEKNAKKRSGCHFCPYNPNFCVSEFQKVSKYIYKYISISLSLRLISMERSLECLSGKRCPSSWTHMVIVGECGPCIPQCQRHRLTLMFIFLVTNPYQPCIHTRQITQKHFKRIMLSNARRWRRGGELGAGGRPGALRHFGLCHENAGNALCIRHFVLISCSHSVLFKFLWLTYGLFTCCQPSCPIKAMVLWMSTKLMWSLLDWMEWCIN